MSLTTKADHNDIFYQVLLRDTQHIDTEGWQCRDDDVQGGRFLQVWAHGFDVNYVLNPLAVHGQSSLVDNLSEVLNLNVHYNDHEM